MTQYLMLFTITPVQSFISQARKTQDLYGGSWLLSMLIDEAVKCLPDKYTLILPSKDTVTKPNRFLAEVETDDINQLGKNIEEKLKSKLEEFFLDALKNAKVENTASFNSLIADNFQVFWTAVPRTGNYHDDYVKVEELLAGVKNLRSFKQQRGVGRKCSVCGEREVLFCANDGSKGKLSLKPNRANLSDEEKNEVDTFNNSIKEIAGWKIAKGEGLCALCFTKRFYEQEEFPSTAAISLMDTLQTLEKDMEANKVLTSYKGLFKGYHFDEQIYYEENLSEGYFEKNGFNGSKNKLPEIRELQKKINDIAKDKGLRLNKYYALVRLDGDDMGRWLSGEFLKDKSILRDFHLFFSSEFRNYSDSIEKLIDKKEKRRGRLVYSGGDDVLAFINLKHLFPVLNLLKSKFPALENFKVNGDAIVKKGKKTAPSSGIIIAHYKTPLSEVLNWSQRMQEEAKCVDGKDAVAIALMTHSGNMVRLVCKFAHIILLKNFTKEIQKNFSDKFVFSMKTEMLPLFERSEWRYGEQEYLYNILLTELKRLLIRGKKEGILKEKAMEIADTLLDTSFREFISFNIKNNQTGFEFDIHNFSALLEVARFMAKETGSDR